MSRAARTFFIVLASGLFAVSAFAGVFAAQQAAADPAAATPTASNQFAILVTTIAGFASLLATHLFQFYRENRNRRWDLADRAAARSEMRHHAENQRIETLKTAIEIAQVSNINREHLRGAIEENTQLTRDAADKAERAYISANNFNEKLEALHKELRKLQQKSVPEGNNTDATKAS